MSRVQSMTDVVAVGFPIACTVQYLLLPVSTVALASMAVMVPGNETVHQGLLLAVLPTSLMALNLGCRQYRRYRIHSTGLIRLSLLVTAAFFGHDLIQWATRTLRLAGAARIALSQVHNYRLCQRQQ